MRQYVFFRVDPDGKVRTFSIESCRDTAAMLVRAETMAGRHYRLEVWERGRCVHVVEALEPVALSTAGNLEGAAA